MALADDNLNTIGARMLADYDAGTPGLIFGESFRLDLPDAWRLQTVVTQLREERGDRVIGYKVGGVDPGNQELLGLPHPVWGRLWGSELHESGASLQKSDYANLSIEAEFGISLSRELKPGMSIDELTSCVESVYPVLELHNQCLRGDPPHGAELVANNCINCGVVRGAPVTNLSQSRETDLKLIFDGQTVDEWESLRWPDDILAAVDWLAQSLAEHGLALQAGDLVLTSAWGPPIPVANHTRIEVTSSTFGNVFATIA